jgi:hypothetical protein
MLSSLFDLVRVLPESGERTRTSLEVFVIRGETTRESLAHFNGARCGDVSNHHIERHSLLGCECEFAVVRSYSI